MNDQPSHGDGHEARELADELDRIVNQERVYASFRERGPKELKEVDVARDLLDSLTAVSEHAYRNLQPSPQDPPDCVAINEREQAVAIEVTEFVSEGAVRLNEAERRKLGRRPDVTELLMAQWTRDEFIAHVASLLAEKDGKILIGGPFEEYVVVVHTDEPLLEWKAAEGWLSSQMFGPFKQVSSAYLLFSYHPGIGYPFVPLQVR